MPEPTPPQEAESVRAFSLEGKLTAKAFENVLQRVLDSRTVAYLLVSDGISEKCFFFPVGAVRLTSVGRRTALTLDRIVFAHPDVTPDLRLAVEQQTEAGRPFDEAASEAGLREIVRDASKRIVRDELLDVVLWTDATYEFRESNPPQKFYRRELSTAKLSLGVRPVLEEVKAAIDRWSAAVGRKHLGADAIVTPRTSRVQLDPKSPEGKMAALVGAEAQSFDALVLEARRHGLDAVAAGIGLLSLAEAGVVDVPNRPPALSSDERKARAQADIDQVQATINLLMDELTAHSRLAGAYEDLEDKKKAAHHLRRVAGGLEKKGRFQEAIDHYRRVLNLNRHDFPLRRRLMSIFKRMGRESDAFREGHALAKDYQRFGLLNRAKQVFYELIGMRRDDPRLRREFVDLLVRMRDDEGAVEALEDLGFLHEQRDEEQEALFVQQQILKLRPDHEAARDRLQRAARQGWSFLIPYLGLAGAVLLLLGLGAIAVGRYRTAKAFDALQKFVATRVQGEEPDTEGARAAIAEFERTRSGYRQQLTDLEQRIRVLENERQEVAAAAAYQAARKSELTGDIRTAWVRYNRVQSSFAGTSWDEKAAARVAAFDDMRKEAARLRRDLERLTRRLATGDRDPSLYADAVETAHELARDYPWSEDLQKARIPVRISSDPDRALIEIDTEPQDQRTRATITRPFGRPFVVSVHLPGYERKTVQVNLREDAGVLPIRVALTREQRWTFGAQGAISGGVTIAGDRIVFGSRDERLYALDRFGGVQWSYPLDLFSEAVGSPVGMDDRAFVIDNHGVVNAVRVRSDAEGESGTKLWRAQVEAGATLLGVSANGLVCIAEAKRLLALRAIDGAEAWTRDLEAPLGVAATFSDEAQTVVAPLDDGSVVLVLAKSGQGLRVKLGSRATAPVTFCGTGYVIATEDGLLRLLAPSGRKVIWQQRLPRSVRVGAAYAQDYVYVPAEDGLLVFRLSDGSPHEHFKTSSFGSAVSVTPVIADGRLFVATQTGKVVALSPLTGKVVWRYEVGGTITGPVTVFQGMALVASEDQKVHAIRIE